MATYSRELRRGLPRVPGGEGWPPADASFTPIDADGPDDAVARAHGTPLAPPSPEAPASAAPETEVPPADAPGGTPREETPLVSEPGPVLRQGLPRVPGGEPWPPAGAITRTGMQSAPSPQIGEAAADHLGVADSGSDTSNEPHPAVSESPASVPPETSGGLTEVTLRRGLPRTPGGDPWPPEGAVAVVTAPGVGLTSGPESLPQVVETESPDSTDQAATLATERSVASKSSAASDSSAAKRADPVAADGTVPQPARSTPAAHAAESVPVATTAAPPAPAASTAAPTQAKQPTLPRQQSSAATVASQTSAAPAREPRQFRGKTVAQWIRFGVLGVLGLIVLAGIIVLAARGLTTLPGVPEFVERYPGEYEPPIPVDPGFPWWARWTHFLNFFFIVLIIRSGLLVRHQQQPSAFYTPKKGGKKISIFLWLHTSLDVLWLVNGIIFIVLMFVTGHWVRVVPTSWEVFPNAASAMLQYLTLEWPVENGWVNYNSLQQLMYFTIVFIAAPLAAITGVRMSEWWPKNASTLNRIYPAPLARAIHYPVMLFFVLFIIVHVFLVFATGALKNLNHMFAGTDTVSWAGFWWFAAGLVVTAAAVWAARPMLLAPIASLTGKVSNR